MLYSIALQYSNDYIIDKLLHVSNKQAWYGTESQLSDQRQVC